MSQEKSLEASVLETKEFNDSDLYVVLLMIQLENRFGRSTFAGLVLVAEMRGGSLPRQVCVIVAIANTIITGRRGRESERERSGG